MSDELAALLWDVDGTLAETERDGHLVAMNRAFAELNLSWRWSERRYGELLRIAGGLERLTLDIDTQCTGPRDPEERRALVQRIHHRKNEHYATLVAGGAVTLRPGVRELMDDCLQAGMRMAIVTTTSHGNVEALLRANLGEDWARSFATIVAAEDAPRKKPDPQAYALALRRLGIQAHDAVAIEDSPAGLHAATAAGVGVVIARSRFFATDAMPGALAVGRSLDESAGWTPPCAQSGRVTLRQLQQWLRED